MKRKIILSAIIVFIGLTVRLFCGVYAHDEFCEDNFFIKHRPTWKWYFYSPLGLGDWPIDSLPKDKQIEQRYFDEFVKNQGLSR